MEIPRLHPETIEEVKQRADIFDVISQKVVLRKRGKEYVGLCPFHEEKTPSFSVNPSKQMYYCFGCGAGGNAINFLMEVGKQSFSDVVLDLARRYQVSVKTLEPEARQQLQRQLSLREQLYEILALASSFYQHTLRQPQGQLALEYLQSQRRLTEETIQQFQLGYAPAGWDTLYRYLVEQKGKPVQQVEQAGLIKPRKSGSGYYDRFRDRLIIPIQDLKGRVIGFGGRTLAQEEPKYLNSPETQLFDKGKTLFALDKAHHAITEQDQAVVVEGYFDVIALHAAGITNVVASLGTALSLDQVRQLIRYTESKQIVLNFDADAAGTKAAQRAIGEIADLAYKGQIQLRVLNLADGKDADEFLKEHADAVAKYRQQLLAAPLWLNWQIEQLLIGKDLKQADQFQQVAEQMLELLRKLENSTPSPHYINYCAQLLSQGDSRLTSLHVKNLLAQLKKPKSRSRKKEIQRSHLPFLAASKHSLLEEAEALLLRIYLHYPEYRPTIVASLETRDLIFSLSHHRFLWQQILKIQVLKADLLFKKAPDQLISLLQDRRVKFPQQMAQVAHLFHLDEKHSEDLIRTPLVIRAAVACLEQIACEKRRRYCLEQWLKLEPSTDGQRKQYYCQQLLETDSRLKELEQMRQVSFSDVIETAQ
ncbi:DNA primase [Lyngbya aestuarii]|uniref:DNA primase n=1 Tax=Lyngbya aestuarii TaxID=118322 RepID=UPI00403E1EE1